MAKRTSKVAPSEDEYEGDVTSDEIVAMLRKKHGDHAAETGKITPAREYISTQSAMVDYTIGRPGIPCGRITNIYGQEGSAKSTLGYHCLAETQRRGGKAILYDAEGAWDRERAGLIGINYDDLIMLEPANMEESFAEIKDTIDHMAKRKPDALICILYDSIAGGMPKAVKEGEIGDSHPAARARIVSDALPDLNDSIRRTNTALILVGQLRNKLEFGGIPGQGPKYTQIADQSLKYWSSLRLSFTQVGKIGDADAPTGIEVLCSVLKNKVAPPYKKCRFPVMFWDGIDRAKSMLDVALKIGLVKQVGSWYEVDGYDKKFRGVDFVDVLAAQPGLIDLIRAAPELWVREQETAHASKVAA